MKIMKQIAALLFVICLVPGLAWAAENKQQQPDATLQLSGGPFYPRLAFSWSKGTLTYKGKEYPISVKGISLVKIGLSQASPSFSFHPRAADQAYFTTAAGQVYDLKKLGDFDGNYTLAGRTLGGAFAHSAVVMKNQNGVRVVVASTTRGLDVTLDGAGVEMRLKK